jgi:predicted transcriptional regulator
MTQITLRGLDPDIEQKIREMARNSGKSLNRVILDMIYHYIGLNKKEKRAPAESLRELAGGWSEKDAIKFQEAIKSSAQIDEEMWK